MSDADATDPVKALREFTALRDTTREFVVDGIEPPRGFLDDTGGHAAARALLSAAPALLARIEAGERAIAGARCWVASAASHDEDARKDLATIDAFLADKEANRG